MDTGTVRRKRKTKVKKTKSRKSRKPKSAVMKVEVPSPPSPLSPETENFTCSNCSEKVDRNSSYPTKVTAFSLANKVNGGATEISVLDALATIFNIKLDKPSVNSGLSNLEICFPCGNYLAEMYRNYQEFLQLSESNSEIYELIKLSLRTPVVLTTAKTEIHWGSYNGNNIELETDEMGNNNGENMEQLESEVETNNKLIAPSNGISSEPLESKRVRKRSFKLMAEEETKSTRAKRYVHTAGLPSNPKSQKKVANSPIRSKSAESGTSKYKLKPEINGYVTFSGSHEKPNSSVNTNMSGNHANKGKINGTANAIGKRKTQSQTQNDVSEDVSEVERTFQGFNCLNCGLVDPLKERMITHLVSVHVFAKSEATSLCDRAEKNLDERQKREKHRLSLLNGSEKLPSMSINSPSMSINSPSMSINSPSMSTNSPSISTKSSSLLSCDQCGKAFKSTESLQVHKKVDHLHLKPFACTFGTCELTFALKYSLSRHMKIHTHGKTEKCLMCPKLFVTRGQATTHLRLQHKNQKSVQKSKSLSKSSQKPASHLNLGSVHNKPFTCDFCKSAFPARHLLKSHILTHQDERPYLCDLCERSFKTKQHLRKHKLCHRPKEGKRNQCPVCQIGFAGWSVNTLVSHLMIAHKNSTAKAKKTAASIFGTTAVKQIKKVVPNVSGKVKPK